jgi:SpoVK/Ycf46/Vps4 family AAA+-type ATPase
MALAQIKEESKEKHFKFRELKVYASTEWLADNKKKYRQVFDRINLSYIYAEVSFYNKKYDVEDWEVEVELRCYSLKKGRKELCILPFKRKVSRHDNIVYVREGWGNKNTGTFWKKGTYYWEAWIEGEKQGSKYFYIEEPAPSGEFKPDTNPYCQVQSIRLYEGAYDDVVEDDRIYLRNFSAEETRYIYAEITLKDIYEGRNWQCELFVKFYNDSRELKGQVVRLQRVEKNKDTNLFTISAGWGSNVKGSWRKDRYTCEIIFMDKLLAVIPFNLDDDFEEGLAPVFFPDKRVPLLFDNDEDVNATFEELMGKLDSLIGLNDIKQKVRDHARYLQFLKLRKENGFDEEESINIHSVFIGNPGTGKTTVANMMGRLYRKMGLLSQGHVHEVDRSDLVGEYIGQTAPKVKEAIETARGGVLFIDEAYSLARSKSDNKDFGREVIEILVKELSNGIGDLAIIVAGYPDEMKNFLDSNPGLKSRFKFFFEFSDYLPQELSKIAGYACAEKEVILTDEAQIKVDEIILDAYRNRDKTFGNARFVHDIIEKSKINLGLRVMSHEKPEELPKELLEVIEVEDVAKPDLMITKEMPHIPIDEELLEMALNELNKLIGLEKVKEQIRELVHLVRYYQEMNKDVLNSFYLHTVFVGNPGTGKTTVARILAKIYKALGVLERGHMVETDRQGMVAGYVGQTATKTDKKITEAMGGVLFIDEAYALTRSTGNQRGDFGDEAIQTLLKRMEDKRGQFFVFVAGYPDNMESFLKANPGLSSRFDKILKFEDYSSHDLLKIALLMFDEEGFIASPKAEEYLTDYLDYMYNYRDKYFGNARFIRQTVVEVIKNQNLRLAALTIEERENISSNIISLEDVSTFKKDANSLVFSKKGIGFKRQSSEGK